MVLDVRLYPLEKDSNRHFAWLATLWRHSTLAFCITSTQPLDWIFIYGISALVSVWYPMDLELLLFGHPDLWSRSFGL